VAVTRPFRRSVDRWALVPPGLSARRRASCVVDRGTVSFSLYVWTSSRFLALVIFTCKAFDPAAALRFTTDFLAMSEVEHTAF
jgi:hypothetical protein